MYTVLFEERTVDCTGVNTFYIFLCVVFGHSACELNCFSESTNWFGELEMVHSEKSSTLRNETTREREGGVGSLTVGMGSFNLELI